MRVLIANKFWYRRGGLERVMLDEIDWLEQAGHEVAHFSTAHPNNIESPWSEYFAPYLELGVQGRHSVADKLVATRRLFANPEAGRRFRDLALTFRPDVVHIHGIHRQISPRILFEAKSLGIPVVQTLHDYHHVCPADNLLRSGAEPCDPIACAYGRYWPAVTYRCVRGSAAASALSAAEVTYQNVRRAYQRTVDLFLSPSQFLKEIVESAGWDVPCRVVPNAVAVGRVGPASALADRKFVLFAGRLSSEKGVAVLLEAAARAGMPVVVAGEGPLRPELESRFSGVADFLGHVSGERIDTLIREAMCCVVPSTSYENAPMSVLEPMSVGTPVVASAVGGIPELIQDGVTGFLVPAGDIDALAHVLRDLKSDVGRLEHIGSEAMRRVSELYGPELHLRRLVDAYESVVNS